jgi:transposase
MEFMEIHGNAALTVREREEVQRRHREAGESIRQLAGRYRVNPSTIQRWIHRDSALDLTSGPKQPRRRLTPEQQATIRRYREDHPGAGARTIAAMLAKEYGPLSPATIGRFLRAEGLTRPAGKKVRVRQPLRVGRHRLQMDIQELPAIRGESGFEYKISILHMATRMKYSEIHPRMSSALVVETLQRALAHLPPFFFSVDR